MVSFLLQCLHFEKMKWIISIQVNFKLSSSFLFYFNKRADLPYMKSMHNVTPTHMRFMVITINHLLCQRRNHNSTVWTCSNIEWIWEEFGVLREKLITKYQSDGKDLWEWINLRSCIHPDLQNKFIQICNCLCVTCYIIINWVSIRISSTCWRIHIDNACHLTEARKSILVDCDLIDWR